MREKNRISPAIKPPVYRLIIVQLLLSIAAAAGFWLFKDARASVAAFLGGMVYTIPNALFVKQVFEYRPAREINRIVWAFYRGEVLKLALTALLFAMVFKWVKPLDVGAFFAAFILVLITNTLAPLIWGSQPLRK